MWEELIPGVGRRLHTEGQDVMASKARFRPDGTLAIDCVSDPKHSDHGNPTSEAPK
jgi:hypothetical protein